MNFEDWIKRKIISSGEFQLYNGSSNLDEKLNLIIKNLPNKKTSRYYSEWLDYIDDIPIKKELEFNIDHLDILEENEEIIEWKNTNFKLRKKRLIL